MILAELTEKNVAKTSFITERGYLFLFRYETLSPMKREKCELRRFFRPAFICGSRGGGSFFYLFSAVGGTALADYPFFCRMTANGRIGIAIPAFSGN
jgi:hypothetical protein